MPDAKSPVLYSARLDKDSVINIPNVGRLVLVHFAVEQGNVQIYFDSTANEPSLKLYPDAHWNQRVNPSEIRTVHLCKYLSSKFVVWVTIEKWGNS